METERASEFNEKKYMYLYEHATSGEKVVSESKETLLKDLMYDYLHNYVAGMVNDVANGKVTAEKCTEILLEDIDAWYYDAYIEDVGWIYEVEVK